MSTSQTVPPAGPTVELAAHAIDVTKTYGRGPAMVTALDRVSVAFGRGRFSAVMGASGSGKSTLLHCLAGLEPVDRGEVRLGDLDLTGLDDRRLTRLRRDRVGFVFQAFNLLPTLTAAENIELPLAIAGRRPDRAFLDRVVDAVGLGDRLGHRPAELAGGEQQRVAAAGVRRRAHRQPRLAVGRGAARVPAPVGRRAGPDRGDGHPRPGRGRPQRRGRVPDRRPHRRPPARAHGG